MRMLIVRLIFLLFSHGVHSLAQYPNGSDVNSMKSDNRSLLSTPITFINTTESSKVLADNRVNIPNQIPRDLNVINKTLSDTDSFVSLNKTTHNSNVSDHNDTYTQNKNNTIVTSINYPNAAVGSLEKYSINSPTTHGTNIAMKMNGENITDYSNKLVNVSDVKTHSSQLANDTKGSDKLKENSKNSNTSLHTTWKKRHVDQSATRILGQSSYEKNPSVHSENIKNVFYLKSLNITHDNGEVENLICTKLEIIPENYRASIIRKVDRFIKKTLANVKIHHSRNGDNNNNNEARQDQNDNNDDDDDDDDEDEYEDDDDDDCGCGCRRRRCCRCRKCRRRKCPSCEKIVTPPPESGRRSGATFPINFESSEVFETTTPLETESPATTTSTMPTLTTSSSTTLLQFITTSPTPTPSTTTIPSTTQHLTTSTTIIPSTTQYPTTSSTTTTTTTTTTAVPSTTQNLTTSSTPTTTTTTTATTIPTTSTTITPTITTAELTATKKRNIKRKKCTKKKRRKEELKLLNNVNGNTTMDNDKEFNSSQPNRVPFSGLFENQIE